jgi:hypothetical protein
VTTNHDGSSFTSSSSGIYPTVDNTRVVAQDSADIANLLLSYTAVFAPVAKYRVHIIEDLPPQRESVVVFGRPVIGHRGDDLASRDKPPREQAISAHAEAVGGYVVCNVYTVPQPTRCPSPAPPSWQTDEHCHGSQ